MTLTVAEQLALVRKAAAAALNAQAELAQEATRALAPEDSRRVLVESIQVATASPRSLEAAVYSDADHAVYQHEALDLHHPKGQSKYMEAAVSQQYSAIQAAGAAAAKRLLS